MAELAKQFVCVRIQSMNGVNLDQFQFEYDLTWMSFFQDERGRTYTRYGGREDGGPESHLTKASLLSVMRQVLTLHKTKDVQPVNRYEPMPTTKQTPEELPTMQKMIGKRKQSCIHCHDVKVANLRHLREQGTLNKELVYTYPSPRNLGMHIDANKQDVLAKVDDDSATAKVGLRAGDTLISVDGQRILTYADFTRVLELAPKTGKLNVVARRGDRKAKVAIELEEGWKRSDDPSWRASTGALGPSSGFWGKPLNAQQRRDLNIPDGALAIRINFIWAKHAKAAGVKNGDVVIDIDGQKREMTVRGLQTHLQLNHNWGDTVSMIVRRGKSEVPLKITFPDEPPE